MICYEIRLSEFPEMQIFLNIYACIWINISPSISHDEKNIRGIIRYDDYALSFAVSRRRQINDTISSSSLNIQNDTNTIYRQNYPANPSPVSRCDSVQYECDTAVSRVTLRVTRGDTGPMVVTQWKCIVMSRWLALNVSLSWSFSLNWGERNRG